MPIQGSSGCSYNGVHCSEIGLVLVSTNTTSGGGSNSLYQENFLAPRQIVEIEIKRRKWQRTPYFQHILRTPIEFDLVFWFNNGWTNEMIRTVGRWLDQEYYKPMVFDDKIDTVFYALPNGQPTITHDGYGSGYVTIHMRCNSPYAFSPVYTSDLYDLSNNSANGTVIQIENGGDLSVLPEISLVKVGAGDVHIFNQTDGNLDFGFTGLSDQEDLYISNEKETIITNLPNTYRYSNFNGNFLEVVRGVNNLLITGNCKIQFRYQFKFIQ